MEFIMANGIDIDITRDAINAYKEPTFIKLLEEGKTIYIEVFGFEDSDAEITLQRLITLDSPTGAEFTVQPNFVKGILSHPLTNRVRIFRAMMVEKGLHIPFVTLSDERVKGISGRLREALAEASGFGVRLAELDLSSMDLTSDEIREIVHTLPSFRSLRTLNLSSNSLRKEGIREIASVLPRLTQLTSLDISATGNYGDSADDRAAIHDLAVALPSLPTLEILKLGHNYIHDACRDILVALPNLPKLKILELSSNDLNEEHMGHLATALGRLPTLTILTVAHNSLIGIRGSQILATALPQLGALTELDISFCNIQDQGATAIASIFPHLTGLTVLNLAGNSIGNPHDDAGFQAIMSGLPYLGALKELNLGGGRDASNWFSAAQQAAIRSSVPADCDIRFEY